MRVLIVDDDASFRRILSLTLSQAGFDSEEAESGADAIDRLSEAPRGHFDVILLDLEMPGGMGHGTLLHLREGGDEVPVIVISGRESVAERVSVLRMGADDYLVKPIDTEELLARIGSVLRRRHTLEPVQFGDLHLDLARRKVRRGSKLVDLSPREYDLLFALVGAKGEVRSRQQLLSEVWDMEFDPETNVVEVHIGRLRRKLERHGPPIIQTLRGKGYRLAIGD
ncbi:MAG: response regulator transcription factor [Planctomycetota bacterium]